MSKFAYHQTHDGKWEVIMRDYKGGRKAYLPRRLCLCTHEDDAKCITEAMEIYEAKNPQSIVAEYWEKP